MMMFHWELVYVCRMGILVIVTLIIPESFWIIIVFEKKKESTFHFEKKAEWVEVFRCHP